MGEVESMSLVVGQIKPADNAFVNLAALEVVSLQELSCDQSAEVIHICVNRVQ